MSDERIAHEEQNVLEAKNTGRDNQRRDVEGEGAAPAGERAASHRDMPGRPRTSKAISVAAVLASLALLFAALAAVMLSAGFVINSRYVETGGDAGGAVIDTWNRTVAVVDGKTASIVPLDLSDAKSVPGGLLWGEFDDVEFTTELQYTNGRLRYEFATEELNEPIRRAMSRGKEIRFLLTSYEGVPLVAIDENFADVVQLIDNSSQNEEPVGVSFTGAVEADRGTWRAIAGVRTQFR